MWACYAKTVFGRHRRAHGEQLHGWAEKDSNLRRAKPDWFTASSDWPLRHLPMEPTVRFELTASCLQNSFSPTELRRRTETHFAFLVFQVPFPVRPNFALGTPRDANHYKRYKSQCQGKSGPHVGHSRRIRLRAPAQLRPARMLWLTILYQVYKTQARSGGRLASGVSLCGDS